MRAARRVLSAIPALALAAACAAASPGAQAGEYQPGAEFRGYPSGEIISGFLGTDLGNNYYGSASISYNFAQRGNNGVHADEKGGGVGGGLTVDKYFRSGQVGWFVGGRAELFGLSIDYRDPGTSGTSDILVFQPTARAGYAWAFDGGRYGLQLGLSLGAEINVHTKGADVGDGAIVLGGVAFSFRP